VTVSTPAAALAEALAGQAEVTVAEGCQTWVMVPEPAAGSRIDPGTGEPGLRLEFRARDGALLAAEHRYSTALTWWDQVPPGIGWGETGKNRAGHVVPARLRRPACARRGRRRPPHADGRRHGRRRCGHGRVPMTRWRPWPGPARSGLRSRSRPGARHRSGLEYTPAADGEGTLAVRLGIVTAADADDLLAEAVAGGPPGRCRGGGGRVGGDDRERGLRPRHARAGQGGRTSWSAQVAAVNGTGPWWS